MTLARASTLHPKPLPAGPPPPPPPPQPDVPGALIFRTGKSIRRAFTTRRNSPPRSTERRNRTVSARIDMIGNPVLHQDEEGKTLRSLAKMGVILGNDLGAGADAGATVTASEAVPPLRKSTIQRKPVPRHSSAPVEPVIVEETIVEEPEPEPFSESEIKDLNVTNKRDKRRGFVFHGLDADNDLDTLRPAPHIMDWKLHDVQEEDEDEDEADEREEDDDMSGQESPVSSSCAHEADPVDSIRWSFLKPLGGVKQDILSLKVDEIEVDGREIDEREVDDEGGFSDDSSEGEDVKEMRRELESVEELLGSITASFAKIHGQDEGAPANDSLKSRLTESSEGPQKTESIPDSNSGYDDESPTLGHGSTLNIIKGAGVERSTVRKNVDTIESMEKAISRTEDMIVKIKASTGYGQKTGLNKPDPLQKPELVKRPPYTSAAQGPEESLLAVLSSPTSRKSFSDFLDTTNNSKNRRDSNILRLWLAARAHSAALQYAEQLAEEIKSTCYQEFPDMLEITQNVEVSKIEDKVFNEMLHKEFPEFRRQSQAIPQGVQDSLDKLVSPPKAAPEVPRTIEPERKEHHEKPISIIDSPIAEHEEQSAPKRCRHYPVSTDKDIAKKDSEIESKKEVMLDSLIKPVPYAKPAPVVKVSGGHQRKIQLSASKHRSFHAVQSFKVDEAAEQVPELPKIPLAYRNSAPSAVNVPSLKPMVAAVEHAGVVESAEAMTAPIADTPALNTLNTKQNMGKKSLADIVRNEIMDTAEPQPAIEKFDLAAMGIVKKNRAALMQRMAALEGAKV